MPLITISQSMGSGGETIAELVAEKLNYEIDDRRNSLPPVPYSFSGRLKPFQQAAVEDMLS